MFDALEEDHRKLYWALRSRIISDDEMRRVEEFGVYLVIEWSVPFLRPEKEQELNAALLQQFRMRLEAERAKKTG